MIDWDLYPTRGRTQWFAAMNAQRPCGVGFGYTAVTTGATGIYSQFNLPFTLTTTELTSPEDLNWEAATTRPGFTLPALLNRKINPFTGDNEWVLFIPRDLPGQSVVVSVAQSFPNLRTRFNAPKALDQFTNPIPQLPNQWTFTPLTRWQVETP